MSSTKTLKNKFSPTGPLQKPCIKTLKRSNLKTDVVSLKIQFNELNLTDRVENQEELFSLKSQFDKTQFFMDKEEIKEGEVLKYKKSYKNNLISRNLILVL